MAGTIRRDNAGACVIDSTADPGEFRLLVVSSGGELSLRNVRLENGCADGAGDGDEGGAIFNDGTIVSIRNSQFSQNQASVGGAIQNESVIEEIRESTLNDNTANSAGAISNALTINTVVNTTFSGNSGGFGGAIRNVGGTIGEISLSSFVDNSASSSGGAIYNSGIITLNNSLFLDNGAEDDCENEFPFVITGAQNLSDGSCPDTQGLPTNVEATLQDNGCARPFFDDSCPGTHALLAGSNAINATMNANRRHDQRGFAELGTRDIGAFELHDVIACSGPLQADGFEAGVDSETELSEAIVCANVNGPARDVITIEQGIDFTTVADLHIGLNATPRIDSALDIDGGMNLLFGSPACSLNQQENPEDLRIFYVGPGGSVNFRNLSIEHGCADGYFSDARRGGGILNHGHIGEIRNVKIRFSDALTGGAIHSDEASIDSIVNSVMVFNNSDASGGAMFLTETSIGEIRNSLFSDNESGALGGAFLQFEGSIDLIEANTFLDNTGGSSGGAIRISSGTVGAIRNNTLAGNTALTGAGITVGGGSVLIFENNTLANNDAPTGAAVYVTGGSIDLSNSLMANNTGIDCGTSGGTFTGSTVLSDGSCPGTIGMPSNIAATEVDNGCVIPNANGTCNLTVALLPGSNAINASTGVFAETDARGFPRVGIRDIGSFESQDVSACPAPLQVDNFETTVSDARSLREAMICSNSNGPSQDQITLDANIELTNAVDGSDGLNGTPSIEFATILRGNGHALERQDGLGCTSDVTVDDEEFRLIHIKPGGNLVMVDTILRNGCADGPNTLSRSGGAVLNTGLFATGNRNTF